jgi:hypothetical protein
LRQCRRRGNVGGLNKNSRAIDLINKLIHKPETRKTLAGKQVGIVSDNLAELPALT